MNTEKGGVGRRMGREEGRERYGRGGNGRVKVGREKGGNREERREKFD